MGARRSGCRYSEAIAPGVVLGAGRSELVEELVVVWEVVWTSEHVTFEDLRVDARRAKTDSKRRITYDPEQRPEVANLVMLAAPSLGEEPATVADQVGDSGAAGLKRLVTEAVNERLRPIRRARTELVGDRTYLRQVLAEGTERARTIAERSLGEVRWLMHNAY